MDYGILIAVLKANQYLTDLEKDGFNIAITGCLLL